MATQEAAVDSRREAVPSVEMFETVVIGGGQAGLAVGYYLKKQGRSFVILDANERIGGSWRTRTWNSLRLFTPARYDGLPGWSFPASGWSYPTARETADYLEAYAARFDLPVRTGMAVTRLAKDGDSGNYGCPSVYLAENGDLVVQGDALDADTSANLEHLPPGETGVRIKAGIVLEAVRLLHEQ